MISPVITASGHLQNASLGNVAELAASPRIGSSNSTQFANLGRRTVRGLAWLTVQAIATKLLQIGSLIPLAWLMQPSDFGLIGLSTAVTALASIAQQVGLKEVLIHRHKAAHNWAPLAFWMSVLLGIFSGLIIVVAALFAQVVFDSSVLSQLLWILAIAAPFQALGLLPEALLHNRMQFRTLATTGVLVMAGQVGLSITMAYAGFGAKSFVIPIPIASALRAAILWAYARPSIRWQPRSGSRRWALLFRDSSIVLATNLCAVVISQGDYAVLGMLVSHEDLGIYFFAFSMSVAPLQLFAQSLNSVLFPALSILQADSQRQVQAGLRATRMLAIITIPASLLQAATAKPLVALLFSNKWAQATPILAILCLGMVWRATGWPSASLLLAQGRFRTRFYISLVWAILLLCLIAISGWAGGIFYAAIAAAFFYSIVGPITAYITFRPHNIRLIELSRIYLAPTVVGVVAIALPWLACHWLLGSQNPALQLLIIVLGCFVIYLPGIYLADSGITIELVQRLSPKAFRTARQPS